MWTKIIENKERRKFYGLGLLSGFALGGAVGALIGRGCAAGVIPPDEEDEEKNERGQTPAVAESETTEQATTSIPAEKPETDETTGEIFNEPQIQLEQPKSPAQIVQPPIETLASVQTNFLKRARAKNNQYARKLGVVKEYEPDRANTAEKYISIILDPDGYYVQENLSTDQEKMQRLKELDAEIRVFLNLPTQVW
jgi:hypothetical protein